MRGPMTNNDSDREVAIFTEVLRLPLEQRDAFLERVCGDDEALRSKLEAMLRAHDRLGNFLEEPPTGGTSNESN